MIARKPKDGRLSLHRVLRAMRAIGITVAIVLAGVACGLLAWVVTYPSVGDPRNIGYVFWKAGLYEMDLDAATGTMIGDGDSDKLVLGKTKTELQKRFGYLTAPGEASPYYQSCYQTSAWKGQDVLFIRKSPWMVAFAKDRATKLILIKGC